MSFQHLLNVCNGGEVKRYHNFPVLKEQSNAHHQWRVAQILLEVTETMTVDALYDPQWFLDLLILGLQHDCCEYMCGDVPANVKWNNPELAQMHQTFEDTVDEIEGFGPNEPPDAFQLELFKFADTYEYMLKAFDEMRFGNTNMWVVFNAGVEQMEKRYASGGSSFPNKACEDLFRSLTVAVRELLDHSNVRNRALLVWLQRG